MGHAFWLYLHSKFHLAGSQDHKLTCHSLAPPWRQFFWPCPLRPFHRRYFPEKNITSPLYMKKRNNPLKVKMIQFKFVHSQLQALVNIQKKKFFSRRELTRQEIKVKVGEASIKLFHLLLLLLKAKKKFLFCFASKILSRFCCTLLAFTASAMCVFICKVILFQHQKLGKGREERTVNPDDL